MGLVCGRGFRGNTEGLLLHSNTDYNLEISSFQKDKIKQQKWTLNSEFLVGNASWNPKLNLKDQRLNTIDYFQWVYSHECLLSINQNRRCFWERKYMIKSNHSLQLARSFLAKYTTFIKIMFFSSVCSSNKQVENDSQAQHYVFAKISYSTLKTFQRFRFPHVLWFALMLCSSCIFLYK